VNNKARYFLAFSVSVIGLLVCAPARAEAGPPTLTVAPPERVIFSWARDRCADDDIPDAPLRAVRLKDGTLFASAAHYDNRPFRGRDLLDLRKDCQSVYSGGRNPDPAAYDDRTWLMSFWTNDGSTIFALGHNEYRANDHEGRCAFRTLRECLYDSVVALGSADGGKSFQRLSQLPIASPRHHQQADLGRLRGFLLPSNIVEFDGFYYAIIQTAPEPEYRGGMCLFRTSDLHSVREWAYYVGDGFSPSASDVYRTTGPSPPPCQPLANLNGIVWSLLKHEPSATFLALLTVHAAEPGRVSLAVAVSKDLIHWSKPRPFMTPPIFWEASCGHGPRYSYPALIDPSSNSSNFETIGDTALLFMTRIMFLNCKSTMQRDLVVSPVELDWATSHGPN
jgi:hypothetical protein